MKKGKAYISEVRVAFLNATTGERSCATVKGRASVGGRASTAVMEFYRRQREALDAAKSVKARKRKAA